MSEKLKNILKNGEEEFNSKAWDEMSKKLDQVMPVKTPAFGLSKILGGVVGISSIIVIGYFVLFNSDKNIVSSNQKNETSSISKPEVEKKITQKITENSTIISDENQEIKTQKQEFNNKKDDQKIENISEINLSSQKTGEQTLTKVIENKSTKENLVTPIKEVDFPKLNDSYCLGDVVTIKNSNNGNLLLLNEQDEKITISPNSTKEIKIANSGKYYFKYYARSEKMYQEEAFIIPSKKSISISSNEDIFYENGMPYIEVSSKDFNENSTWKTSKGYLNEQNSSIKIRCTEKGNYQVTLAQTDSYSCINEESINIQIKDNYNLLAVNAFIPNDHNPKNRTFMPEALKYRQTGFKLTILDSKDNHIVFKSESADNAWEGIDQTTGELVESNRLFIWKVELKNPEPKERAEYTGTIVRL